MTNSASTITQTEVDALLGQLQELRQQIAIARSAPPEGAIARETIAPLEANLAEVYDELQAVVGGLRRQSMRLQTEGIHLHLTDTPPDVISLPSGDRSPATFSNLVQALSVQRLAERSILWIGTARSLFRLDLFTENWRRYGRLGTQDIRVIATTPDQETVWAASWSSDLHGLKQQTELEATPKISEPILALTAGTSQCWSVALDGLYQYKDSAWVQVISARELPVRGGGKLLLKLLQTRFGWGLQPDCWCTNLILGN